MAFLPSHNPSGWHILFCDPIRWYPQLQLYFMVDPMAVEAYTALPFVGSGKVGHIFSEMKDKKVVQGTRVDTLWPI